MLIKDRIIEHNYQKEKMIARSSKFPTNSSFRQMLKRLELINAEILKLDKEYKNLQK